MRGRRVALQSRYFEEDVDEDVVLGPVAIPIAKPPIAPAKIPINAKSSVLSTSVAFPLLDIIPPSAPFVV